MRSDINRRIGWNLLSLAYFFWAAWASHQSYIQQQPAIFKQNLPWIWYGISIFWLISLWGVAYLQLSIASQTIPRIKLVPQMRWLARVFLYLAGIFVFVYCQNARLLLYAPVIPFYLMGILGVEAALQPAGVINSDIKYWLKQVFSGFAVFVLISAVQQLKLSHPGSIFWITAYYVFLFFNGLVFVVILEACKSNSNPTDFINRGFQKILKYRLWIGAVFVFLVTGYAYWLYWYDVTGIGSGIYLRLEFYLLLAGVQYLYLVSKIGWKFDLAKLCAALAITGYLLMTAGYLVSITSYPFSLTWSEGNRFYDYSIIFGKYIYNTQSELVPNYYSPGRYGLWGLPFLVPGLPISIHRAWNVFLYCVPGLILGWQLGREVKDRTWKIFLIFATQLFLNQGPVYPTLTIALIFALMWIRSSRPFQLWGWIAASLFAGISRFTWVLVIGAWAGIWDLLCIYPQRKGTWFQRLLPVAGMILLGILPGMAVSWPEVMSTQGDTIQSQASAPLWYRLMPNSTFSMGVLPGILVATGFLVLAFILVARARLWQPDIWQVVGVVTVLAGFFAICLFASAKIGGGSNLHNMDMYMVCVLLVVVIIPTLYSTEKWKTHPTYPFIQSFLLVTVIIAGWSGSWSGGPRVTVDNIRIAEALQAVQDEIDQLQPGEQVLFIDQRQLITFRDIQGVELHPEYEKKFMMDQAMAGNAEYFKEFYADLDSHRFSLIINETQKVRYQDSEFDFNEENNAWVKWVSEPFLRAYKPVETFKEFGFSIYKPK